MQFKYHEFTFAPEARLLTASRTTSGHIDRYEFNFIEESEMKHVLADYGDEDADLADGIPAVDGYVRPDTLEVLRRDERRIDTTQVEPVRLRELVAGDVVVFTSEVCGHLVAEVEIPEEFDYDDGVFEFETEDGFMIGFDERPSSDIFVLLGVRA
jgi:hypothetical protein